MLELLSIFAIEVIILHVDIQNYTMQQRSIHCIIMVFMWAFFIGVLLLFSRKHYHFPEKGRKRDKISSKSWIVTLACFIGCKIMTFIDWHTLKIVGEAQGKTVFEGVISFVSLRFCFPMISSIGYCQNVQYLQGFVGAAHTRPPE